MISKNELKDLLLYHDPVTRVLSVYLNVDQANAENLNRGFERTLKNLLRDRESDISLKDMDMFRKDAQQVERFVQEYSPRGKTLVMFANAEREFFWQRSLNIVGGNEVMWNSRPHIRPLIEANDEFQRYGVILTDRAQARIYTVAYGEIEEDRKALAEAGVRRYESTGRDHLLSQMIFQRKADEHAKWHLKNVAGLMDRLLNDRPFDRLILAGPTEAVSELKNLLPERLKDRVIDTVSLPLYAHEDEVLSVCMQAVQRHERSDELGVIERLKTGAGKKQMAVIGLEDTVRAAMERRIHILVYADNYRTSGSECLACNLLYDVVIDRCGNCGGEVEHVPNFLERLIERVTQDGGAVEMVKDDASSQLRELGGIGALLRF